MTYGEPRDEVRDEASGFAAYLNYYRDQFGKAVLALPPAEHWRTRVSSGWTPLELLSHVLHMERRWFVWVFLGEDVVDPWGDWNSENPWGPVTEGEQEPRWEVPDHLTAETLVELLRGLGERTTRILADHDLDEVAPPSPRWEDDPLPTLRWICFHVLQEYARHAGHLDIAVELAGANPDSSETPPR